MTMSNTKARVKVNNMLSEEFEFKAGVKQGDGLSAILFDLTLHKVINVIDQRGTIVGKSGQICAYADDIAIITRSMHKLKQMYEQLEKEEEKIGLIVNEKKAKYMIMSKSETRIVLKDLIIGRKKFKGVSGFRYLGATIHNDNEISREI